jgi:hypothetical protein
MKQTAMQQLLTQLKNERLNLPMNIEWDRCYQAIEMVIVNTYLPIEKEQIIEAYDKGEFNQGCNGDAEHYFNETFKKE